MTFARARVRRAGALARRRDLERQLGEEREVGPVAGEPDHRVEHAAASAAERHRERGRRPVADRLDVGPPLDLQEAGGRAARSLAPR